MNKEELLVLGLTEEQAEKVLVEMGSLQKSLKERDKQFSELQKAAEGNEELQKQIADLQQQNAEQQKAHKAELAQLKLDNAIDNALTAAGAKNLKAVRVLLDMEKLQLGEDGKLQGWPEQLEALQKSDGYLFAETQQPTFRGFQSGAASDGRPGGNLEPAKMNYEELCAYIEQNPGVELK